MQSYKDIINNDNKKKRYIEKKFILYSVHKMGQYGSVPLLLSINSRLQTVIDIVIVNPSALCNCFSSSDVLMLHILG